MSRPRPLGSDQIAVGRIVRPHGLRGELVTESLTDNASRFEPGSRLQLAAGEPRAAGETTSGRQEEVVVAACRWHRRRMLLALEGIADRDAAEALRGALLTVSRAEIPPAPAGSYYHFDLIGCRVEDRTEGPLGKVREVREDGGGLLLEVVTGSGVLLVPFVEAFLRVVDVEGRRIEVELPPGLVRECESTS